MVNYTFNLRCISSSNKFKLPLNNMKNVSKVRVKQMRYITASANQEYLLISIKGFNDLQVYMDSNGNVLNYTKLIYLAPSASSFIAYENLYSDTWDFEGENAKSLAFLDIDLFIDNLVSADITNSNPVHLELVFSD